MELSPYVDTVVPKVDTNDLIDAHEVAEILGLSQRNSVSLYQRRYPEMPRPVVKRGGGRTKLWLRSEIARWNNERQTSSTDAS
jgi:predicted DNA-binding transcriptional regulator AlpA